ncbi:TetR/AcrR family transcriptional regulator [Clostridium luticellarii]|jgi:AcrR family transcriptional regulator|uniref:TetR/AcrR family transcriptional regulator n=1 Tax=Clostridium luticellarii TaxID=1691940 RepID=UPI0023554B66|nr:TetR/AcrR family transcriptional regulator [Clostridium luticellarii]MCI1945522.1 TetR/AcrR family transcriptional regulator [Clostridium luticellarii]MCI1969421.1 TetR/AcrR family transcriptional regulator [Clostridium luticellarii]
MNYSIKQIIKKAAEKLILQKGFRDTTIKEISRGAKISVGTIYRYYKSKEEILNDIGRMDLKDVSYSQDNKRKEIMDVALDVFGTKGYTRTNMEDIANKMGMSKAFIYQYFNNKDELFLSTIRESSQIQTIFNLSKVNKESINIEEILTKIGMKILSIFKNPQKLKLMRIIIAETPNFPEIGELFFCQMVGRVTEALNEILRSHASSDIDPVLSIRLFIGAIWSLVFLQEMLPLDDRNYDDETIVKNAVKIFQRGTLKYDTD